MSKAEELLESLTVVEHEHEVEAKEVTFEIDPETRTISNVTGDIVKLLQGDHQSTRFVFEMPRYVNEHDMMLCNMVYIPYINSEPEGRTQKYAKGVYMAKDLQLVDENTVKFTWLVTRNSTYYAGVLSFMTIFECMDGKRILYSWGAEPNHDVVISAKLDSADAFEYEYIDIIEQWKSNVKVDLVKYIDAAVAEQNYISQIVKNADNISEMDEYVKENFSDIRENLNVSFADFRQKQSVLESRVNMYNTLKEGSTTGDAELMDIRITESGAEFDNAGEAVRAQFGVKANKHEAITKSAGKNLFNRNAVTLGAYLNGTVNPIAHADSFYSDYIPVEGNTSYAINTHEGGGRYICFYDEFYDIVAGGFPIENLKDKHTFVTPEAAKFMRISSYKSIIPSLQIELGTESTEYEEYFDYKPLRDVKANVMDLEKNILKRIPSKNLFDESDITPGYYLMGGGELVVNEGSFCSGFMPVEGGSDYTISNNSGGGRYICFYDRKDNPTLITGIAMVSLANANTNTFKVPEYANYMRISHFLSALNGLQVEKGTEVTEYEEYYEYAPLHELEKTVDILMEQVNKGCEQYDSANGRIMAGGTMTLADFPMRIKNGMALSFYGKFDSFSSLLIGKGYEDYRGRWFEITETDVILHGYEDGDKVLDSLKHGLAIEDYISLNVHHEGSTYFLRINTSSGTYMSGFDNAYDANGTPFVTVGSTMENCVFNATSEKLDRKLWMFGDSYFGLSHTRVIGQLRDLGYFSNMLINGLAGIGSNGSYFELLKCLKYGTPDILVWCVGMNDSTENYAFYLKLLKGLCDEKGITLILTKIPSVPERDKEGINAYVLDSGLRYVDWYAAVGANEYGRWYPAYLSSDLVHPSELGAKALAMRLLVDVPEIMRQ